MTTTEGTNAEVLTALEKFVVDNDDLLALEERIGRFNIFDALGIARTEIRHSNFLAWLLDPAESHGQGSLFLKAVLMDLLKQAPADMRPLSPIELDGEELRGVEIRREWRKIDLLITCQQPQFVIAIENKIDAGEHSGQLQRYEEIVATEFRGWKSMFVFLTREGDDASDEDWLPYSYADTYRVLERVRRSSKGAIGDDVTAFLEHYLRLIGSRFMDDPEIDALCQRIYKNHRQAIELLWDRVGASGSGLPARIASWLRDQPDRWVILTTTTKRVDFVPASWPSLFPPIGGRKKFDPACWIVWRIECRDDGCHFAVQAWPTSNEILRRKAIDRLIENPKEFGFKVFFKGGTAAAGQKWTRLCREDIAGWSEGEEPDLDVVMTEITNKLDATSKRMSGIPDALQPIFDEWRKTQSQNVQR